MNQPANPVPISKVGVHPEIPYLKSSIRKARPKKNTIHSMTIQRYKDKIKKYREEIKHYQEILAINNDKDLTLVPMKLFEIMEKYETNRYSTKVFPIYSIKRLSELTEIKPSKIEKYLELISYIKGKPKIYSKIIQFRLQNPRTYYSMGAYGLDSKVDVKVDP